MKTFLIPFVLGILLAAQLPVASAGPNDVARDLRQTMQARRLLALDAALVEHNIGVFVKDRVATLWGPAASAEVAFRAELCLRTMLDLVEVRNELIVTDMLEPMRVPKRIEPSLPHVLPELLPPVLPRDTRLAPPAPAVLTGNAKQAPVKTIEAKEPPTPANVADEERELAKSIRVLLQSKSSYGAIQFAIQGRRVYLKATDPQLSDVLHEAARVIARLPNVDGVILLEKMRD